MDTKILEQSKKIKLIIFDVDGVLTDGNFYYVGDEEVKGFNTQDGLGMKMLQNTGVKIAIITGRKSSAVEKRMSKLGIDHVFQGQDNKLIAYDELKKKLSLNDDEIAYVGDDLPDVPVMLKVGLAICVANATKVAKDVAHWKTSLEGGRGAAREACEFIMMGQGTLDEQVARFRS